MANKKVGVYDSKVLNNNNNANTICKIKINIYTYVYVRTLIYVISFLCYNLYYNKSCFLFPYIYINSFNLNSNFALI